MDWVDVLDYMEAAQAVGIMDEATVRGVWVWELRELLDKYSSRWSMGT